MREMLVCSRFSGGAKLRPRWIHEYNKSTDQQHTLMLTPTEQPLEGEADPLGNATDMQHQGLAETKVHLAIAALERAGESAVAIDGYLGTSSDLDVLRLYPAIDTSVYVEIPRAAIIYMEARKCDE